ncbi:hypothetical protein BC826DRAFT_1140963 [Russula brevipes]|nr:hypothetical protein BC826DRAFT_1140963 [Russula brevipes]
MASNHHDPNWQPPYPGPPQCSHDGRGPYYPPAHPPASSSRPRPPSNAGVPANPQRPPMPIFPPSAGSSFRVPQASTRNLPITNYEQKVSARITTDAWVMGFIVGIVHFCTKVTAIQLAWWSEVGSLQPLNSSQVARTRSNTLRWTAADDANRETSPMKTCCLIGQRGDLTPLPDRGILIVMFTLLCGKSYFGIARLPPTHGGCLAVL